MKKALLCSILAGGMAVAASAVSAEVIDFTDASTGTSGTVLGSVTWTMTSAKGTLNNYQSYDGLNVASSTMGLAFDTDGYGAGSTIYSDEINSKNTVTISFSEKVGISGFAFLDLYKNMATGVGETAILTANGISYYLGFDALNQAYGGYAEMILDSIIYADTISFTVASSNDGKGVADGALAGLSISDIVPVPLPAAGALLLGGLGGLSLIGRRRKNS